MSNKPDYVKKALFETVRSIAEQKDMFVRKPGKDFVRHRTFDFTMMIKCILSFICNTLATEILNFFDFQRFPTVSAFVQQREKIRSEAFHQLLLEFNKK